MREIRNNGYFIEGGYFFQCLLGIYLILDIWIQLPIQLLFKYSHVVEKALRRIRWLYQDDENTGFKRKIHN